MLGILQSSVDPPFLSKTFNAIAKEGNAKAKRSALPMPPRKSIGGTDAFRNTMNAALGRAKDGEDRASAVEPIFGDLINSLHMRALTQLPAKMPAGAPGAESEKQLFKSKTRFLPNLI